VSPEERGEEEPQEGVEGGQSCSRPRKEKAEAAGETIDDDTQSLKEAKKGSKTAIGNDLVKKSKKRKAEGEGEKAPTKKKKKDEPKAKAPKPKAPIDVEKQCGVPLANGGQCARSLTCKSHSMGMKRAVPGRSLPYDILLANYQKKNQAKQQRKYKTFHSLKNGVQKKKKKQVKFKSPIPFDGGDNSPEEDLDNSGDFEL